MWLKRSKFQYTFPINSSCDGLFNQYQDAFLDYLWLITPLFVALEEFISSIPGNIISNHIYIYIYFALTYDAIAVVAKHIISVAIIGPQSKTTTWSKPLKFRKYLNFRPSIYWSLSHCHPNCQENNNIFSDLQPMSLAEHGPARHQVMTASGGSTPPCCRRDFPVRRWGSCPKGPTVQQGVSIVMGVPQ